jgi:NTE family protein
MSDETRLRIDAQSPATRIPTDDPAEKPSEGIALCLSGGGYRAMVFHLGALIRLNELGLLPRLKRISSVSGGSITSAMLGLKWKNLAFGSDGVAADLLAEVVTPIRALAATTIDEGSIIGGILLPGSINERVAGHYAKALYGDATLQDLPTDGAGPRFVINATNVQTGALWRFSKPYMGDWMVGLIPNPTVRLADAVGASSAFPPFLSPAVLKVDPGAFKNDPTCPLQEQPFTSRVILSDGGVYDNLGLETAWKRYRTVLVSDAGGKLEPEPMPKEDWAEHAYRVLNLVDNQVRCLRKRQIIDAFQRTGTDHDGTYWGIRTNIADYGLSDALVCPHDRTMQLADVPTRLKALEAPLQERLINWGYAVCDAAMRKHAAGYLPSNPTAPVFPYFLSGI